VLTPVLSTRFKRDVKRAEKRGKDLDKLKAVLSLLIEEKPLTAAYGDHPLKGDWRGFRDLHIEPDWPLLYRIEGSELQLARTGSHSNLFNEQTSAHKFDPPLLWIMAEGRWIVRKLRYHGAHGAVHGGH
jgi:mRNA interferase YafQ